MMDDNDFADVTDALLRYQPAAPTPERASKIAAALTPRVSTPSSRRWWLLSAAAAILLALGAGWVMDRPKPVAQPKSLPMSTGEPVVSEQVRFKQAWLQQVREEIPFPGQSKGVTIVVFMDWLCPVCIVFDGDLRSVLEPLRRAYPGRIAIFFEDWPWDPECNDTVTGAMGHEGACELASAVRQARSRGRDRVLIDWIGQHQKDWRDVGLPKEFRFPDPSVKAEIDATVHQSIAKGKKLSIKATPTTFINGIRVTERLSAAQLDQAIRIELERVNGSSPR